MRLTASTETPLLLSCYERMGGPPPVALRGAELEGTIVGVDVSGSGDDAWVINAVVRCRRLTCPLCPPSV